MKRSLLGCAALALAMLPVAGFAIETRPLTASFDIAPAEFSDPAPDAKKDTLLLYIDGAAAEEMWNAMDVPVEKEVCGDADLNAKSAGDLQCLSDPDGYHCSVGINLTTGATHDASTC